MLSSNVGFISLELETLLFSAFTRPVVFFFPWLFIITIFFFFLPIKDDIPTVGPANMWGLLMGSLRSIFGLEQLMEEGHRNYRGQPFKCPELGRWRVIVSNSAHIEELRRASDDVLSFQEGVNKLVPLSNIFGSSIARSGVSTDAIRKELIHDFSLLLPDMLDELFYTIEKFIPGSESHWTSVPAFETLTRLTSCITSRIIVSEPICRNEEYLSLARRFTGCVMQAAACVRILPKCMRSFYIKYMTPLSCVTEQVTSILKDNIELRLQQRSVYGDSWPGKPIDMLSWIIDKAEGEARSVEVLTQAVMGINFAAIHSTSMTLTNALYQLAVMPECIETLREEISSVVDNEGFSKIALSKMRLLDSFIRESMRLHGIMMLSSVRLALRDFSFSDGTFIPIGTQLAANTFSIHHDDKIYENADKFIPFRFIDKEGKLKTSASSTSTEFLAFGYGKHSCPGRFLAMAQVKATMAHIILNYDFKLDGDEKNFPECMHIVTAMVPNIRTKLSFRKRPESVRL